MDVKECIVVRRSVRQYTGDAVPVETIRELISAAIFAPSACNFQAWKFLYVYDKAILERYVELGANALLKKAPGCMVVAYRNDIFVSGHIHADYIQSASAAIQNFLLLAYEKGIGTCWVCDLPDQEISRCVFKIPGNFDVIACVLCGYPQAGNESNLREKLYHFGTEEDYSRHTRKFRVDQVLNYNCFEAVDGDCTHHQYPGKANYHIKRSQRRLKTQLKAVLPDCITRFLKKGQNAFIKGES